MNKEKIINGYKLRSLFDTFCHEFKIPTVETKILILASLNHYGLLREVLKEYQSTNKKAKKTDRIKEIPKALSYYINHLNKQVIKDKEDLNYLITLLERELTVFSNNKFTKEKLIKSFLENNEREYKEQKKFYKVDLYEEIYSNLEERDLHEEKEFQEKYTHLYNFLMNSLIPAYRENNFSGFFIDTGSMDYQTEYVVKYFLQEPNKKAYFEAIKYSIDVLFFGKEPYHKFVLFRNNYKDSEQIEKFYRNNETAIHLNSAKDFEDWDKFIGGGNPEQQYLQRWKSLNELIKEQDVIVVSGFQGIGYKIGKIKQGAQFEKSVNGKSVYYFFKIENAKDVNLDSYQFVQTLLPANVTLSNLKRKSYSLGKIFPGVVCNVSNFEMDDIAVEILVSEWLRSKYAPKEFRIKYQILRTGGSKKDIDISGITENDENLIVQVSNTDDLGTIKKKITKLEKYEGCRKLFFFNCPGQEINGERVIDIKTVIDNFRKDSYYQKLIAELG